MTERDLDAEIEALAVRIEMSIRDGRATLAALPDYSDGRSERARELRSFLQRGVTA